VRRSDLLRIFIAMGGPRVHAKLLPNPVMKKLPVPPEPLPTYQEPDRLGTRESYNQYTGLRRVVVLLSPLRSGMLGSRTSTVLPLSDQCQILDLSSQADPIATARVIALMSRPNSTTPSAAKHQRMMNARNICTCRSLNVR
jgi:hypothetical protein